jgi:hypothetical protein
MRAGRGTSLVEIQTLEGRRLLSAAAAGVYEFGDRPLAGSVTLEDGDGTVATFSLRGGKGRVTVAEDGTWSVDLSQAGRGAFSFAAAGGDGRVVAQDVKIGGGIAQVKAPGLAVAGGVVEIGGTKKTVTLGDLTNVTASVAGSAGNSSITLGNVTDVSLTSAANLQALSVASWGDTGGTNDVVTAPAINTLKSGGAFAADLVVGTGGRGNVLGTATVGGDVAGDWTVNGSAGKVTVGHVLGRVSVAGNVAGFRTTDFVAAGPVAGGGSIRVGGRGTVQSAAEKTALSGGVTVYTSATPAAYDMVELMGVTRLGESHSYRKGRETFARQVLPATQTVAGRTAYVTQETGQGQNRSSYEVEPGVGVFLLDENDPSDGSTIDYVQFQQAPATAVIGQKYAYSAPLTVDLADEDAAFHFNGSAARELRLVGHEVVTVPAGTFVAAKFVAANRFSGQGSISAGGMSLPASVSAAGTETVWLVPGIGAVRTDNTARMTLSVPRIRAKTINTRTSEVMLAEAFTATATTGAPVVRVTWQGGWATRYDVYRSTTPGADHVLAGAVLVAANVTGTRYADGSATPGQTYYYFVVPSAGPLAGLAEATASGSRIAVVAPVLGASRSAGNAIRVTWTATPGADHYVVYRAASASGDSAGPEGAGATVVLRSADNQTTEFFDTGTATLTGYRYWVRAFYSADESGEDGVTSAAPAAGFRYSTTSRASVVPDNVVRVYWDSLSGAEGYRVYRSADISVASRPADAELVAMVGPDQAHAVDNRGVDGQAYKYWVTAVVQDPTVADPSAEVELEYATAGTGARTRVYGPVGSVRATQGQNYATITWDPVPGATAYTVYTSPYPNDGPHDWATGNKYSTYAGTGNSYTTWYEVYRSRIWVVATMGDGSRVEVGTDIATGNVLHATDGSRTDGVMVTLLNIPGTPLWFEVYRSSQPGEFDTVQPEYMGTAAPNSRTFNDTTAVPGVTYYYFAYGVYSNAASPLVYAMMGSEAGWRATA